MPFLPRGAVNELMANELAAIGPRVMDGMGGSFLVNSELYAHKHVHRKTPEEKPAMMMEWDEGGKRQMCALIKMCRHF